ncbi:MAG: type IX secretion system membrane protein PorP/SprF, partial [Bacteroidia bacterium]
LSYDQRISPKAGFIGVSLVQDVTSQIATRQVAGLQYAYEFKLSDEIKLRTAASLSYVFIDIDTSKIISASPENFPDKKAAHFGLGSIITYRNIFAGISAFNYSKPLRPKNADGKPAFVSDISAQAGGFFPTNKSNPKSTVIAPYFLLYAVTRNFAIAPGVNINKGIFTGGICYRGNKYGDAVAILAGVSKGWIKAGYTYDLGIPDPRSVWAASHELTLTIYPGKLRDDSKEGIPYYFRKMGF